MPQAPPAPRRPGPLSALPALRRPGPLAALPAPPSTGDSSRNSRACGHRRRPAPAIPGDHPRALGGVGRCDVLPDQRIEQRGLAGLQRSGECDPQGRVELSLTLLDPIEGASITGHGRARCSEEVGGRRSGAGCGTHQAAGPVIWVPVIASAARRSAATADNSLSSVATRAARSESSSAAADCAALSDSLIERAACSAISAK